MAKKVKFIAQIGLGYWGKNILRNLYELDVLHTACDASRDTISNYKEKYPDVNYTSSFPEILESSDIRAVVISSPAVTHYELVKKSLLAGKDVFVEKPLSLAVEDAAELVDIAEKEGRILMVGHILQYHPAVIKLRQMIIDGELGKVHYIYSNRLNIGKLRTEENILWSFAPHDISVILSLVGEEPIRVSSIGGDYLSNGVYDTTMTSLEFSNGIKSHIFVSWLHPFKEQKLVVVGSRAMAVFDDMSKEKLFIYPHKIEWKGGKIPIAQKADFHPVPLDQTEPLKEELKHFIDCVNKRTSPKTDGHEGLSVLRILEQAENAMMRRSQGESPDASKTKKYYLHESSFVDDNVIIGDATKIWHFSHILSNSKIGKKCIIGQNVSIGPEVTIGNNCKVQNNVSIYKGVTLEDSVFCGPSCVFTNVYNPRAFIERKNEFYNTLVRKGVTIGANATIVCGISIGEYALIGAGSVVKNDVPDYAVMAGVPAKQKGWACKCGVPLKFIKDKSTCKNCKSRYAVNKKKLVIVKEEV